jgi:hypothetical protein
MDLASGSVREPTPAAAPVRKDTGGGGDARVRRGGRLCSDVSQRPPAAPTTTGVIMVRDPFRLRRRDRPIPRAGHGSSRDRRRS